MEFLVAVVLGGIGVALIVTGAAGNGPGFLKVITGPGLPAQLNAPPRPQDRMPRLGSPAPR